MTKMTDPKVIHLSTDSTRQVNRTLAQIRSMKPSEVVIWYQTPEKGTGVLASPGISRVKTVGALTAAAYETWES